MGYGKVWSEEKVIKGIMEVMDTLGIDRMPSRSEVEFVRRDSALTNKIAKTGGFYYWAERLGFGIKGSETQEGIEKEKEIAKYITKHLGWKTELTPIKFPYDILVGGVVKVDVKYSKGYNYSNGNYYSFNLEYTMPKCDVLVLICGTLKTLVIPAHTLKGKNQISAGNESKYDRYIDKWDIINTLHESMFHTDYFEEV